MRLCTAQWDGGSGWSAPLNPAGDRADLVLAFGSPEMEGRQDVLDEIQDAYPGAHLLGCSTAGEILGDSLWDGTISLAAVSFDSTVTDMVSEPVDCSGDSYDVGIRVAKRLSESSPDLSAVFVLSDGLVVNGSALVAGLNAGVGPQVSVTGGLAGDGDRFGQTWVITGGEAHPGYVTAVGFSGDRLVVGHGSRAGWDGFGPLRQVTRSEGNVLHELDGQPALGLYKQYLGDRASGLPATALLFPLSLRPRGADRSTVVRTILAVDEENQTMTFAGDVPEGAEVQLMRATFERLIDGAQEAGDEASTAQEGPVLAVAVSCVGRRLVLGQRVEDELEATLASLPPGSDMVGFYSYGEVSPAGKAVAELHNQTMTVTTLAERL